MTPSKKVTHFPELDIPLDDDFLKGLVGYQLQLAANVVHRTFSKLVPREFTSRQLGLLVLIANNPGVSQAALASWWKMDRSTTKAMVGGLIKNGWILTKTSTKDKRKHALSLTAKGKRDLAHAKKFVKMCEEEYLSDLSKKEIQQMLDMLIRIKQASPGR